MESFKKKSTTLLAIWVVVFSICCCLTHGHFVHYIGNQNTGDVGDNINSSLSEDNGSKESLLSAASLRDEEKDTISVNKNSDTDGRTSVTANSAVNEVLESTEHSPGTGNGREISDNFQSKRSEKSLHKDELKPATGGEFLNGMEWIIQKVIGDAGLRNDSTDGETHDGHNGNSQQNMTRDSLHSENVNATNALVGNLPSSANTTTYSNVSSSQSSNTSHPYNFSRSNATNATNSNSTSPGQSSSGKSSAAVMLVKLLLASLYVAGPSAGIFLVSPVYAIATRNLLDYFIGSPATVDLLHGAGILGLVVDLTWGAVD